MKRIFYYLLITALSAVCNSPCFANAPVMNSTANWFVATGAGEQFPISSDSMRVNNGSDFPAPYNQDSYSMSHNNSAVFALSAGRRWKQDSVWLPSYSIGILWQNFLKTHANGSIMQYSDPEFTNYNYRWNIKSNMLLATGKLNLVQHKKLSPYINGGLGTAFTHTNGYTETVLAGVTLRDNPGFTSNTSSQFAYQAGAGVDLQVLPQLILSLGYNYQNLGDLSSGKGTGTWSDESLRSSSLSSNEVLVSVSYLFGN